MDHSLGIKRPITSFQSGTHLAKRPCFVENGMKNMDAKIEGHANKCDKVNATVQTSDFDSKEAEIGRTGAVVQTRKCNDSPAVVPIKKRRIQILEATRSPSPPPTLPKQSSLQELSPSHGEICTTSSSNSFLSGVGSSSSPKASIPGVPSLSQACPISASDMCEAEIPNVIESTGDTCHNLHPEEQIKQSLTEKEECFDDETNISPQPGCCEDSNGHVAQNIERDQIGFQTKPDGQLVRSESGSFSRDDRLHWDLNTDMAAWDDSMDQGMSKLSAEKSAEKSTPETLSRSPSIESTGIMKEQVNEDAREQLEEDMKCKGDDDDNLENETACSAGEDAEEKRVFMEDMPHTAELVSEEQENGDQGAMDPDSREQVEDCSEMVPMDAEPNTVDHDFSENSENRGSEKEETTPPSVHTEGAWQAPVDSADHPDAGKVSSWDTELSPDCRDLHENSETIGCQDDIPERHKFGKQGKSFVDDGDGWNDEPELEEHVDYGDSDCKDADDLGLDVDERTSSIQVESRWKVEDGSNTIFCEGEVVVTGDNVRSSLSDAGQLSEKHSSSGRNRTTGWDQLPEGFNSAEEALRAAKEDATRRGGRVSSWSNCAGRGSLHSSRFGASSVRSHNRDGFSSARGDSYYGERHPDEPIHDRDSFRHSRRGDDNFNVRGRDPARRPGVFGRGRGSGWMDSQPGPMNQWGSGRHRSGSAYSGPSSAVAVSSGRPDNGGFAASPDGAVTKSGMGPGRGGLRSAISGGRVGRGAHSRGPPVDMDGGAHYPLRGGGTGMGFGFSGSMHDRSGRGMMDLYRGRGIDSRRSLSPRRALPLDHSNMMGRMPSLRPESRVVRSRTPPAIHRSMGSSDFNTVRNQRSPPPSRWSNEKRELDNYQERDFKKPMSRVRVPPQRTSPHVVHGSSLTDERDRQVLARHSPPLKSSIASSHLRKSKDDSLDSRAIKRFEEEDVRYTGVFGKDAEYRRGSPPRETLRERDRGNMYRRDRERDDERRRDFRRSSSRDGRLPGGTRHSTLREGDDDVAPRRRRPS